MSRVEKSLEAMKIMEALSGVDEELLARCEASGVDAGMEDAGMGCAGADMEDAGTVCASELRRRMPEPWARRKRRSVCRRRYLSRCAAVFALAVVGAVSWSGIRMLKVTTFDSSGAGGNMGDPMSGTAGIPFDGANGANAADRKEESVETEAAMNLEKQNGPKDLEEEKDKIARQDAAGFDNAVISEKMEKEITSCPALAAQELTEVEARQIKDLGAYVPTALPAGYIFESARYVAETGRLTVCWCKGMDNIRLSVEQADDGTITADIGKPETYDERLYEIPYGDTIPEEYREVFFHPVFAKDDFSLEIVRSRVISYSGDGGDTSTPRGNFYVLYDGVLVGFNGRGTPEEIWEMFTSISK